MTNDALAHLSTMGAKPVLDPVKPFRVKKNGSSEIVWAHTYQTNFGALQFIVLKMKPVTVEDKNGVAEETQVIVSTPSLCIAAGQWSEVFEELVQDPKAKSTKSVN